MFDPTPPDPTPPDPTPPTPRLATPRPDTRSGGGDATPRAAQHGTKARGTPRFADETGACAVRSARRRCCGRSRPTRPRAAPSFPTGAWTTMRRLTGGEWHAVRGGDHRHGSVLRRRLRRGRQRRRRLADRHRHSGLGGRRGTGARRRDSDAGRAPHPRRPAGTRRPGGRGRRAPRRRLRATDRRLVQRRLRSLREVRAAR